MERCRRKLTLDVSCHFCAQEETVLHVVHDCPLANHVWLEFLSTASVPNFFDGDLASWLEANLQKRFQAKHGEDWVMLFGCCCWIIWKWRNELIFTGKHTPLVTKVYSISVAAQACSEVVNGSVGKLVGRQRREVQLVGWQSPDIGWVALNTDGAFRLSCTKATAEGVFRDEFGNWLGGFQSLLVNVLLIVPSCGVFTMDYWKNGSKGGGKFTFVWIMQRW